MLRGFIRVSTNAPAGPQREALGKAGVEVVYVGLEHRDELLRSLRNGDGVAVFGLHRLATSKNDLRWVLAGEDEKVRPPFRGILLRGAYVRDLLSDFKITDLQSVSGTLEAVEFWNGERRGGVTRTELRKWGLQGGRPQKKGRMPVKEATAIWRDPALTTEQSLEKINGSLVYGTRYSLVTAYRKLGKRGVEPGRWVNGHVEKIKKQVALASREERLANGGVYFIQAETGGPVKIGFTTRVVERLSALQTSHHGKLKILALIEGKQADEKALHARFVAQRIEGGEWFKVTGEFKKYLASLPKFDDL